MMRERPPLQPIHWADLAERERPPYLVKRWLHAGRFSVMYGEPGVMKSFVALDLALHVVLGKQWHGHSVKQGAAVYVAAEGGGSIDDRLMAFCKHHKIEKREAPLYVLPRPVNLGNKSSKGGDGAKLTEAIKEVGDVELVVIDTLSRALFGGNENAPDDMGAFIGVCDAIRSATGAHVLVIHHTGKDVERGARGHSSLKAATDTELQVTKADGVCLVKATKQRDTADDSEIGFRWHSVEVGLDEDAEVVTSLVLERTEDRPAPESKVPPRAQKALDALWQAIKTEGVPGGAGGPPIDEKLHGIREDRWRELCGDLPLTNRDNRRAINKAFTDVRDKLLEAGKIKRDDDQWVWPTWSGGAGAGDETPF